MPIICSRCGKDLEVPLRILCGGADWALNFHRYVHQIEDLRSLIADLPDDDPRKLDATFTRS